MRAAVPPVDLLSNQGLLFFKVARARILKKPLLNGARLPLLLVSIEVIGRIDAV